MQFLSAEEVRQVIRNSPDGRNTKFLAAAHNLWTRFKNYDTSPPICLKKPDVVAIIFATFNRDGYTNLYEIVTVQGQEGKGYASEVWDLYVDYAFNVKKSTRLKLSCTPSSVTWHMRNGLVFWAVDPSGSLRSDQPLFSTRQEQKAFQQRAILDPSLALPSNEKVREQFTKEDIEYHKFGVKKKSAVEEAIQKVGDAWIRRGLSASTLEAFYE